MAILYFSDVLCRVGLDPAKVKLIRHALTDPGFKACYNKKMVLEYTRQQKRGFSRGYDYWAVFISDKGTKAKFYACYRVGDSVPDTPDVAPDGFPRKEWFQGENEYYDLSRVESLSEYENRLVIDWGTAARAWHQKGSTEQPIVSISSAPNMVFSGYENLILSYRELKEIVENQSVYSEWHTALSSVNAIYLIVDRTTGKQYVGSAYGEGGLLGRWSYYVSTLHGGNKLMKELICCYPERYQDFQFSILQILPKTLTSNEIIDLETLYKRKLLSFKFGMNDN